MRLEKVLGWLILADFVLGISTLITERVLFSFLPPPLQAYLEEGADAPWTSADLFLLSLWAAIMATTIAGWIGLLNSWRAGREIYLASWIAYLLYILMTGPTVMTPVGSTLDTLMTLVGGSILGLAYFSELRHQFKPQPALPPELAGRAA